MAKASKEELAALEGLVGEVSEGLPDVTSRKMFGCHALWASGNVFALVWKEGRIGVRLPDEKLYEQLSSAAGAGPWKAGPMNIAHWVLVPPAMHAKKAELRKWVSTAHALAQAARPAAEKKPAKKAAPKKTAQKKASRKAAPAKKGTAARPSARR